MKLRYKTSPEKLLKTKKKLPKSQNWDDNQSTDLKRKKKERERESKKLKSKNKDGKIKGKKD